MEPSTPTKSTKRKEYDTPYRSRFFCLYDQRKSIDSFIGICRSLDPPIPPSTGRTWLRKREKIGDRANRRTRRLSQKLGRRLAIPDQTLDNLLDRSYPNHYLDYHDQVVAEKLSITSKTLQRNFAKRRKAKRYKKLRSQIISEKNKKDRMSYGNQHRNQSIHDFWQYVYFTDESHFNSLELSNRSEYELRQEGSQQRLEAIQETHSGDVLNVTVHVSAGISYQGKGSFIFYKDPAEVDTIKQRRPRAPRKSKVETDDEFRARRRNWEETQLPEVEIKPKGNAMNQKFYASEILPYHISHLQLLNARYHHQFYFQEDNDPSHGTRSQKNPPAQLKRDAHLLLLYHPAQSPDLNPIESIWQVIKQRIRGGRWRTVEEFKDAILQEWNLITRDAIRKRISEMPWRCEKIIELKGKRVRSILW